MPPLFSVDQQAVQQTFRQFAVRELLPGAGERDRSAEFPAPLIGRLRGLGAMGISLPAEYCGLGLDTATQLIAIEEVAFGDAALASVFTAHYLCAEALLLGGTGEQRASALSQSRYPASRREAGCSWTR